MAGPPYPSPNAAAPLSVMALDPVTGAPGSPNMSGYTAITTAGTTTVRTTPGAFNGLIFTSTGTLFAATVYDIVVAGTTTNLLLGSSVASALNGFAGLPSGGIRTQGVLVVVTSGTAGSLLALWD